MAPPAFYSLALSSRSRSVGAFADQCFTIGAFLTARCSVWQTALLFGDSHTSPAINSGPVIKTDAFGHIPVWLGEFAGFPHAASRFLLAISETLQLRWIPHWLCKQQHAWFVEQLVSTFGECVCACLYGPRSGRPPIDRGVRCLTYTAAFIQRA